MDAIEWGVVGLATVMGTVAMKIVAFALRHGVVRHRHYFGPVYYRKDEPVEYYGHLLFWVTYLAICYGGVAGHCTGSSSFDEGARAGRGDALVRSDANLTSTRTNRCVRDPRTR